ncbi:class I SAM-dependent methyltransferase [Rhodopseudomonas palustris]|uniref:Class I SAM-dependent methyltransferase n=1 Tax=Rhodopseudomonas palustris TaxID=1076 RepID=A0A418UY91_RHOPL|nr:class I SAM-dependent methyltransferase [Rhodopseudomonas palustris]RJF67316.1 class I SAM-dependent methyltransferase [Rhodopseudomonas palustris]
MSDGISANEYWNKRKTQLYYQVVQVLSQKLAVRAKSVVDVGSNQCPYLEWFPDVPHRTSLDLRKPFVGPGIKSIKADFLAWDAGRTYDLALCLQVLEHIPRADLAAKKLLDVAKTVVVSVPYKWPVGTVSTHVHDPVDEQKMLDWFGRKPNFSYLCREVNIDADRLIHVYERNDLAWKFTNQRNALLKQMKTAGGEAGPSAVASA